MFWLLAIPVIGAVVAAVASSDDSGSNTQAQHQAQAGQKAEAEAEAAAKASAAQRDLQQRRLQLLKEATQEVNATLANFPHMLSLPPTAGALKDFSVLEAFTGRELPTTQTALLKHLATLAPGVAWSPEWAESGKAMIALRMDIKALESLKEHLLG